MQRLPGVFIYACTKVSKRGVLERRNIAAAFSGCANQTKENAWALEKSSDRPEEMAEGNANQNMYLTEKNVFSLVVVTCTFGLHHEGPDGKTESTHWRLEKKGIGAVKKEKLWGSANTDRQTHTHIKKKRKIGTPQI